MKMIPHLKNMFLGMLAGGFLLTCLSCRSSGSLTEKDYMRHMNRGGGDVMEQEFQNRMR